MTKDIYEEIVELRRRGARAALATIVSRKGSTPRKDPAKMLIYEDGSQIGTIGGGCTEAEVCREALIIMRSGKSKLLRFELTDEDANESALLCGGTMEVYVEPILPDPTLIVFGAGHVGQAVAELAHMIGFKVTVADDRLKYANQERFPNAQDFKVAPWEDIFKALDISSSTYLLIATRGHQYDMDCLRFALNSPARYIGLLGSRRKTKLLFEAMGKEGVCATEFQRVYSPVGIEIGSETPEEIAVSIAAELIALRKNLDVRKRKGQVES